MDLKWEDIDATVVATTGKSTLEWIRGGLGGLFKRKTTIAITGMQGVGKSVLLDFLTGEAYQPDYKTPLQSQAMETGVVDAGKKRLRVSVIPGQA